MPYCVLVSHFETGAGYSHTEQMDSGLTEEVFTAKDWNAGLDNPFCSTPGSWVEIEVTIYAKDADPMFDDPFYVNTYVI